MRVSRDGRRVAVLAVRQGVSLAPELFVSDPAVIVTCHDVLPAAYIQPSG